MVEQNKPRKWPRLNVKPTLPMVVALLLILVLIVEGGMAFNIRRKSKSRGNAIAASSSGVETVKESLQGVSLYASGRDFKIDNDFLVKLSALHEEGAQMVRIPIDFSAHSTLTESGLTLDGEWLRQTASIMEMIFQSNYQLILSVRTPDVGAYTPDTYLALWTQIDAAFGHRPADEMWYDLSIPSGADMASWGSALRSIISLARATNAERGILLSLPKDATDAERDAMALLFAETGVDLGVYAAKDMSDETFSKLEKQAASCGGTGVLLEPEGGMADAALAESIRAAAGIHGFGYLLQGD